MYSLFMRIPDSETSGLTPIAEVFRTFVTKVGMDVLSVSQLKECDKLIERHVEKYHLFKRLIDEAFCGDHRFQLAMKEALQHVINQDVTVKEAKGTKPATTMSTAELMADYIDAVLKDKMKLTGDETWTCMDNVVALFTHLQEKDVFRTFHSELLAKRLLLSRDKVNMDYEGNFISKLKTVAGAYFTGKMEKMITDLNQVADTESEFEEFNGGKIEFEGKEIKIEAQVLTRSNWPSYSVTEMKCPPAMQACMDSYKHFYATKHEKRTLTWIHTVGTAQVHLNFIPGKVQPTVTVSVIQAAMLMLFNQNSKITCGEMSKALGLDEKTLKKYFGALALPEKKHPEYQLLAVEQPGGPSDKFSSVDVLSLNVEGLGSLKKKLKSKFQMPLREMKVDGAEQMRIHEKLMQERVWNIDAMIVRTMKNRQRMTRGQLTMAVVQELNNLFPVLPAFVIGRIQVLAEGTTDEGQILKPIGDDEYEYIA